MLSDKFCSVVLGSLRSSIAAAQKNRAEVVPDKPSATHPASFCPRDTPSGSITSYACFQWGSHGQSSFPSGNHKNYWRDWRRALDCKNPKAWFKRGTSGCRGNPRDHAYQLAVGFDQLARFSNCWLMVFLLKQDALPWSEIRSVPLRKANAIDIPVVLPSSWLKVLLLQDYSFLLSGGAGNKIYMISDMPFGLVQKSKVDLRYTLPIASHGDEGRYLKKGKFMVCTVEALLGVDSSKKGIKIRNKHCTCQMNPALGRYGSKGTGDVGDTNFQQAIHRAGRECVIIVETSSFPGFSSLACPALYIQEAQWSLDPSFWHGGWRHLYYRVFDTWAKIFYAATLGLKGVEISPSDWKLDTQLLQPQRWCESKSSNVFASHGRPWCGDVRGFIWFTGLDGHPVSWTTLEGRVHACTGYL